jgi:SAM-dependent methyltransferase
VATRSTTCIDSPRLTSSPTAVPVPAGPAVMQLASMFVRAVSARTILDLGCGIGYSTFSLAKAAVPGAALTAIDSDPGHIELAQAACSRLGLEDRVSFVVRPRRRGAANHRGACRRGPRRRLVRIWSSAPSSHAWAPSTRWTTDDAEWFLLVEALTGAPRNDWERFAGPTWADDALDYAKRLAARRDLAVSWTICPPLGVAVKLP